MKQTKEEFLVKKLKDKGQIVLKARYGKQQGAFVACPVADPMTKQFRGVDILTEEEKKKVVRVVALDTSRKIIDNTVFRYASEIDRVDWAWVVHNVEIDQDRDASWSNPSSLYFVEDLEEESEKSVSKKQLILEAQILIHNASQDRRTDICRLFGFEAKHMKPNEVYEWLYDKASTMPEKVMEKFNDADTPHKIFLMNVMAKKIIVHDTEAGFYRYNTVKLGAHLDSVIAWLKSPENQDLIIEMRKDLLN